jgi:hypothetical protein
MSSIRKLRLVAPMIGADQLPAAGRPQITTVDHGIPCLRGCIAELNERKIEMMRAGRFTGVVPALPQSLSCDSLTTSMGMSPGSHAGEAGRPRRSMDGSAAAIWFVGDLSDPWVATIADALPASHGIVRIDSAGELPPGRTLDLDPKPRLIVVHRRTLAPRDADWLKEWRPQGGGASSPALVLCVGPYVRYEELERYSGLVDLVLSEATAADVLPRHVARLLEGRAGRTPRAENDPAVRVLVASSSTELCRTIAEACAAAGYRIEQGDDEIVSNRSPSSNEQSHTGELCLTIWDVPVLEAWTERLERHARHTGPVVALMGFPDRNMVAQAKSKGAIACLELPLNLDDLVDVIDRFTQTLVHDGRSTPARAEAPHILPPRPRRGLADRHAPASPKEWPSSEAIPRMTK